MRWILALAVVVVASKAYAENELMADPPRAISTGNIVSSGATIGTLQTPAQPSLDQRWAHFPSPVPIDTKSKVCAIIDGNSFTLKFGPKPSVMDGSPNAAYLICDKIAANSSPTESSTLNGTGCKVFLPGGSNGKAAEASYCAKSSKLTLRGSKEEPVELTIHAGGSSQTLTASELVVDIKPVAQPTIAPAQTTPATYFEPTPAEPDWNNAVDDPRGVSKEPIRE
jgi:hypothetical protein